MVTTNQNTTMDTQKIGKYKHITKENNQIKGKKLKEEEKDTE